MHNALNHRRGGFTLVEIMIVVAIIAMLAAIAVPNFLRARKRSQATRVLEDLRVLDYALDRWAIENNMSSGDVAQFSDLAAYLNPCPLLSTGADLFGQPYGPFTVDIEPSVAAFTFNRLSDVAPPAFWSPYYQ